MFSLDENRYGILPLFLIAVVFIVLAPIFWMRVELPQGVVSAHPYENLDLYERTYPNFHYGFSQMREGQIPLWNPYQFCGVPFQADPATGLFQPLHLLFFFLSTERAMALLSFLGLCLMGSFFVLFLRSLQVRYTPACFGALVYAFSGTSAAAMSRPELIAPLAWLPLAFWALSEYGQRRRLPVLIVGALAAGFSLLSGGYALVAAQACALVPYAALCIFAGAPLRWREQGRSLAALVTFLLATAGVSGIQWIPSLLHAAYLSSPGETLWRLELAGHLPGGFENLLLQLLGSEPGVLPRPGYIGIATLLVLPAALFHRPARRESLFFAVVGVLALIASVLSFSPGQEFPSSAWLFPATFALATLAGLGLDRLLTVTRDPRSPYVWIPVLMLLAIAGGILVVATAYVRGLVILNVLLLLPFLLIRARWLSLLTAVALTAFLYVDFSLASVNYYRHPFADGPALTPEATELLRGAEEQALNARMLQVAPGRALRMPANLGMLTGIPMAGGAAISLDPAQRVWWEALRPVLQGLELNEDDASWHPSLLNFISARVLLVDEEAAFGINRLEREGVRLEFDRGRDRMRVYVNETALPRTYWVPHWVPAPTTQAAIERLVNQDFASTSSCVITAQAPETAVLAGILPPLPERQGVVAEGDAAPSPASQVDWEMVSSVVQSSHPQRVVVQVEAPQPGLLVLTDTFAPGWRATVDGIEAHIYRANGIFRAVQVPAGARQVVFQYRPEGFSIGLAVSLTSLTVMILGGMMLLLRRNRQAPHDKQGRRDAA